MSVFEQHFGDVRSFVARVRDDRALAYKLVERLHDVGSLMGTPVLGPYDDLVRYACDSLADLPAHPDSKASLADVVAWGVRVLQWSEGEPTVESLMYRRAALGVVWGVTVRPYDPPIAASGCAMWLRSYEFVRTKPHQRCWWHVHGSPVDYDRPTALHAYWYPNLDAETPLRIEVD